ncbi:MAG: hypothetical protein AB8B49_02315 [Nitratireductor sp.]
MNSKTPLILVSLFILTSCVGTGTDLQNDPKFALSKGILAGDFGLGLQGSNKILAVQSEYNALENGAAGAALNWTGTDGVSGAVTPGQIYRVGTAKCRTYVHNLSVAGQVRSARGTACKEPNEEWLALN